MGDQVDELPHAWGFRFYEKRPEGVEEELQDDPYGFCEDISHEVGFSEGRNVHVDSIDSLEAMVLEVVFLEGDRHWYADGEVGENAQASVVERSREGEVVAQLVNS